MTTVLEKPRSEAVRTVLKKPGSEASTTVLEKKNRSEASTTVLEKKKKKIPRSEPRVDSREVGAGAGIMEADDRQVTTVFTVQPSFHHRHSTNRVS